jgi:hypothetical protein
MTPIHLLKPGVKAVRGYAERLVKDVPDSQFGRLPVVNGQLVNINHPAFVLGHLSLYPIQLAEMSGLAGAGMEVPETYPTLFKMGVACVDDPQGAVYPSKAELVERYFGAYDALVERIAQITDSVLDEPLKDSARREKFGTVGAFLAYLLLAHPQVHFGQISAWRRCMGLGPV